MLRNAFFSLCLAASLGAAQAPKRPVDYVKPEIDTVHPRWIFFASASRPFGLVSLSPDTLIKGDWGAGYVYGEPYIRTFSHVHDWQLGGVPVMPVVGQMKGAEGYEAYKAAYSHESEVIRAGYHKVTLKDSGIVVELTSTKRVGLHRYSYPATDAAYVLLDVGATIGPTDVIESSIRKTGPRSLAGWSKLAPTFRRPKPCTLYFVVDFDRDPAAFGGWERKVVRDGVDKISGPDAGGYAKFAFKTAGKLGMKVAISYVSEEGARKNMSAEAPGWDFDAVVRASAEEWNSALAKFEVSGGTEAEKVKFYTDLQHSLLGRRTFSDHDGRYVDNTGAESKIRQVPLDAKGQPTRSTYNTDGFWGSQWGLHTVWAMAYPRLMRDQIESLLDYYRNGGMTARGPAGGNYTFVMVGDQAMPLIAAAYAKGIRDFDTQAALAGGIKNAEPGGIRDHAGYEHGPTGTGGGMAFYAKQGWIPVEPPGKGYHRGGAAQTMEYAYQDWCLSEFAAALGKTDVAEKYAKRSRSWRNLYDPSTGWIRPKNADGSWLTPFAITCDDGACPGFVEANAAIYTYYVPQDVPGLIETMGGPTKFIERLNNQFEQTLPKHFVTPHGTHGRELIDYENEPSSHLAYLFAWAGEPWRTQYWVRKVKSETFGETTWQGGYHGDEDQGLMGSLGALMAIGLFDTTGGAGRAPRYEITAPLFDRVVIHFDPRYHRGGTFTITSENNKPENVYIQSATLNGQPLTGRFWITQKEFEAGGKLHLVLGPQPNKSWGVAKP
jgi:predicted alpha-1,2-mannosidase